MHISEFQRLIHERYFESDSSRGVPGTFLWLTEEFGELASALADRERGKGNDQELALEFADVLAWLFTIANVCDIDIEDAIRAKYLEGGGPLGIK